MCRSAKVVGSCPPLVSVNSRWQLHLNALHLLRKGVSLWFARDRQSHSREGIKPTFQCTWGRHATTKLPKPSRGAVSSTLIILKAYLPFSPPLFSFLRLIYTHKNWVGLGMLTNCSHCLLALRIYSLESPKGLLDTDLLKIDISFAIFAGK